MWGHSNDRQYCGEPSKGCSAIGSSSIPVYLVNNVNLAASSRYVRNRQLDYWDDITGFFTTVGRIAGSSEEAHGQEHTMHFVNWNWLDKVSVWHCSISHRVQLPKHLKLVTIEAVWGGLLAETVGIRFFMEVTVWFFNFVFIASPISGIENIPKLRGTSAHLIFCAHPNS